MTITEQIKEAYGNYAAPSHQDLDGLSMDGLLALAESHERLVREATAFLQGGPDIDRDNPAKKLWDAIEQAEKL